MFSNLFNKIRNKLMGLHALKVGDYSYKIPTDMAWCFSSGDYYEKNVIFWIDKIIGQLSEPVIYDIGANYGYYTLRYAPIAKHVYSFEPVTKTFRFLSKNIKFNKIKNVTLFKFGLSEISETRRINLYNSSGNNSLFARKVPDGHPLKKVGEEAIKLERLDDITAERKLYPPSFMKIDVEGAELFVLKGAERIILEFKPVIIMEYSANTSSDAGYQAKELIQQLISLGIYKLFGLTSDDNDLRLIPFNEFSSYDIANIIAVPEKLSIA